jgi:hypothetical protein
MGWKLHRDISFCRVDGRPVFLDIGRDCYFRLPAQQEITFCSLIDGHDVDEADLQELASRHILAEATGTVGVPTAPSPPLVTRSAIEEARDAPSPGLAALAEVVATTLITRWELKHRPLRAVLARAAFYRDRQLLRATAGADPKVMDPAVASALFMRARVHCPLDMVCLLDSLSMLKFLARRGARASIVFAVASDPFSAHCWVQAGNVALNDTVGNVRAHTPIWIL